MRTQPSTISRWNRSGVSCHSMRTELPGLVIVDVQRDKALDRPGPKLIERHHVVIWMPPGQDGDAIGLHVQCRDCIPINDNGVPACCGMREVKTFLKDYYDPQADLSLWPFEGTLTVSRAASISLLIEGFLCDEETAEHLLSL